MATIDRLSNEITKIATSLDLLRTEQLPEIQQNSADARDGVIELRAWAKEIDRRLGTIDAEGHICVQSGRLNRMEQDDQALVGRIDDIDTQVNDDSKLVVATVMRVETIDWWRKALIGAALGMLLTLVTTCGGVFWQAGRSSAAIEHNTQALDEVRRDLAAVKRSDPVGYRPSGVVSWDSRRERDPGDTVPGKAAPIEGLP